MPETLLSAEHVRALQAIAHESGNIGFSLRVHNRGFAFGDASRQPDEDPRVDMLHPALRDQANAVRVLRELDERGLILASHLDYHDERTDTAVWTDWYSPLREVTDTFRPDGPRRSWDHIIGLEYPKARVRATELGLLELDRACVVVDTGAKRIAVTVHDPRMRELMREAIAESPPQYTPTKDDVTILRILAEKGLAMEQEDIAAASDDYDNPMSRATIGRRLKPLREAGLVERPHGRRSGDAITETGRNLLSIVEH